MVSALVYFGLVGAFFGLLFVIKPIGRLGVRTRPRAVLILAAGLTVAMIGLVLPAGDMKAAPAGSRLDQFVPVWQFSEYHRIEIDAAPDQVFAAIRPVRADEVTLLRTLTWIRRAGRDTPESILNPGSQKSLFDVALNSGFSILAEDPPREIVISTVPTPGTFAAMNFLVRPDGPGRSILTTETRVFASTPAATRAFGVYWRLIYPGSALIRRSWLRAIKRRATGV